MSERALAEAVPIRECPQEACPPARDKRTDYELTFRHAPIGLLKCARDWQIEDCNEAATCLLGDCLREVPAPRLTELFSNRGAEFLQKTAADLQNGSGVSRRMLRRV